MDVRTLVDTRVLDVDGRSLRLAEQWKTQPAVVVWLRHFGCLYCTEHARELMAVREDIERSGGRLVFVGNGGPRHAKSFQQRLAPEATVLTDPGLDSYRAIGARKGVLRTVGPRTWASAVRALRRGARQSSVKGHPFQQGGVVVVAPGNRIVYAYLSEAAGDHPPVDDVLDAVRRASPAAGVERPRQPAVVMRG
jgi:peroxiredoxin